MNSNIIKDIAVCVFKMDCFLTWAVSGVIQFNLFELMYPYIKKYIKCEMCENNSSDVFIGLFLCTKCSKLLSIKIKDTNEACCNGGTH